MAAPGGGRRATLVTLDLDIDGSTVVAEESTTFEEDGDYDTAAQKWQPKHERFAQILSLRHQKRREARIHHALDNVDEVQSSPRTRLSSLSVTSSFAGLPPTQQQLTKVMASIEQAQEEAKQELERESLEREAAQLDNHSTMHLTSAAAPASGGLSGDELSASCALIQSVAQAMLSSKRASNASSSALAREPAARIEIQGLEHIGHHHQERVLTMTDLAIRHRIVQYKSDACGVENYMSLVSQRDAPLIPKSKLMIPDDPPLYELPDAASGGSGAAKGKKSKLFARGAPVRSHQEDGSPTQQRLTLPELMRAYEDHCLVADKALEQLRVSNTGASMDPRIVARLRLREQSLICEPIPGIRTLFYFPPLLDAGARRKPPKLLPEDRRVAQLESCARRSSAKGLQPSPLSWEFLGSQAPACLAYGCHRSFHSVFEYDVVLHPRRFYLNLERMCRGLAQPLTLRRLMYLCYGRPLDELTLWHRLYVQYRDAKKLSQVRQWVERFAASFGELREAMDVCRAVEPLDDIYIELPCDASDPLEKGSKQETEAAAAKKQGSAATKKGSDGSGASAPPPPSPYADTIRRFSHPFGVVDYVMEMVIADTKRKKAAATVAGAEVQQQQNSTSLRTDFAGQYSSWLHSAEVPVATILRRFQTFLLSNTSRDELVEAYLTFLPMDVGASRRAFLHNVDAGILPPSSVWLPPNTSLEALEAIENNVSAKAVSDRDARTLMQCLATFRAVYHSVLSAWVGEPPHMDDPSMSQSVKKRNVAMRASSTSNAHIPTPTATSIAGKRLLRFASPPLTMFAAIKEEMHPDWSPVEGWQRSDFGGMAARPGDKPAPKKKKKSNDDPYGFKSKASTVVQGDVPALESINIPFVPSQEEKTADGDDEEEEDDEDAEIVRRPSAAEVAAATEPHSRFSDFDVLMLYHGQGLYFEAFVALLGASPQFLRDLLGLILRFAVHFQPVE